jgi:selenocysteine lyase/cysteine desulfurase
MRDVLPATGAGIYLTTHVAGPMPADALSAAHASDDMELRIGRAGPGRAEDLGQREQEARAVAAAVLGVAPERVALGHGAAEVARSVALELLSPRAGPPQGVIVVEGLARPVARSIGALAQALGADLDVLPAAPRILGPEVALVVMAHVDPFGRLLDPAPVASAAHRVGARLLLDASFSVGAMPMEAATLGADAILGDGHHWLLGPDALAWAWLAPAVGHDGPARIREAAAPFGRGQLLAFARSVGWLLMYAELPWVVARTSRLARRLRDALGAIDGVTLLADGQGETALMAFRVSGWDAAAAADELSRSVFAITDADVGSDVIRVSVGAWNREDELDRFVGRVAELASSTPTTLPRRPALTVVSGPPDGEVGA